MKRSDEDYDDGPENFQIGSLHAINDFEPDEDEDKKPRPRLGFHPVGKQWD